MRKPHEFGAFTRAEWKNIVWGERPAIVRYVVDGDSFGAMFDAGGKQYGFVEVRLADLDTDELDDPDPEKRARAVAARDLLATLLPIGTAVKLGYKEIDNRGRYVAWVRAYTGDGDGRSITEIGSTMLASGLAWPWART